MKNVFNFSPTARRLVAARTGHDGSRLAFALRLGLAFAFVLAFLAPRGASAQATYWTTRDLLADFFRQSEKVTWRKVDVDAAERQRIELRLGSTLPTGRTSYTFFVAETRGHVDGYALFDEESGQHLPITFAVKLSPAGVVERQEIVAYREARGDEVRDARFRAQFVGKTARDALRAGDDIVAVSGATISSRAMAIGVKRALVLLDELILKPARAQALR